MEQISLRHMALAKHVFHGIVTHFSAPLHGRTRKKNSISFELIQNGCGYAELLQLLWIAIAHPGISNNDIRIYQLPHIGADAKTLIQQPLFTNMPLLRIDLHDVDG